MGAVGGFLEDVTGLDVSDQSRSDRALAGQQAAANQANSVQREMYDQTRSDLSAYRDAGASALAGMQSSDFQKDFTMSDFTADPGYQFRMAEGLKALNNSAAAQGGRLGGAQLKALSAYSGNLASEEYQKAYDRFNNDRNTRYSRLSNLAGLGQNSAAMTGSAGQNYASAYGQNVTGAANAAASQLVAQANQTNSTIGNGVSSYLAFSDERLKTNIVPITKDELAEMKRHLKAYRFNYKKPEHGSGDYVGVMAQDLEKSSLGRSLVFEDNFGNKQIDLARVMMLFLATMAEAS